MSAFDTREIDGLFLRLRGFQRVVTRPAGMMRGIAHGLEAQTVHRLHYEKTAPDGTPWRPWSLAYAATRDPSRHSLLKDTWAMVEGIDSKSTGVSATVFSRRPYAGAHQDSQRAWLPSRPFLGLSAGNVRDLQAWLSPALEQMYVESVSA